MKLRSLIGLVLVVAFVFAGAYAVVFGASFGMYSFEPMRAISLGMDLQGGTSAVLRIKDPGEDSTEGAAPLTEQELYDAQHEVLRIMRARLDEKGYTGATLEMQGDREIRVNLPINETSAFRDADQIVKYLAVKGDLTILDSDDNVIIPSSQIELVMAQEDSMGYRYLSFSLTKEGKEAFEKATAEIAERGISQEDYSNRNYIKLHYEGTDIAQATIKSAIETGQGSVQTNIPMYQLEELVQVVNNRPYSVEVEAAEMCGVSPSLGENALRGMMIAGIAGLLVLALAMILCYRIPGLMAAISMLGHTALVLLFLAISRLQITAFGMAGLFVGALCMAAMSLMIVNGFKKEFLAGKAPRAAAKSGCGAGAKSVFYAGLALCAALLVFILFGIYELSSFAFAAGISVICAILCAVVLTQPLVRLMVGTVPDGHAIYFGSKKEAE